MTDRNQRTRERERGTWRAALREKYAPWFDDMIRGFQVGDGWQRLIEELTAEIAGIVGGPDAVPEMRVVQVREKFAGLRYYVRNVPEEHQEAVRQATRRAEQRSFGICEQCSAPGETRNYRGYYYTACGEHPR